MSSSNLKYKPTNYLAGIFISSEVVSTSNGLSFWWYIGIIVFLILMLLWYLKRKRYL